MDEFPKVMVKNIFISFDLESYFDSQSETLFMKKWDTPSNSASSVFYIILSGEVILLL